MGVADVALEDGGWMRRMLVGLAIAIALGGTLIGYRQGTQGGGNPPPLWDGKAAVWVIASASPNGTCTRASTPETYADAVAANRQCNPGDSSNGPLMAGYAAANCGDTVGVKADATYPDSNLRRDPGKDSCTSSTRVTMRPYPGDDPQFGPCCNQLNFGTTDSPGAQHLYIRDFSGNTMGAVGTACALDVVFDNDHFTINNLRSDQQVTIKNSELGPGGENKGGVNNIGEWSEGGGDTCWAAPFGSFPDKLVDATYDHNYFHDYTTQVVTTHSECLQTGGQVQNLVFTNNTFQNCTDFDIHIDCRAPCDGLTVTNNFFDAPLNEYPSENCNPGCARGGSSVDIPTTTGNGTQNIVVSYNTSLGFITFRAGLAANNVVFKGNIGQQNGCDSGIDYDHNMWSDTSCGTGDVNLTGSAFAAVQALLVDGTTTDGTMNFHLAGGTNAAVGAGDTGSFPATDIDGDTRTSPPDAGADER